MILRCLLSAAVALTLMGFASAAPVIHVNLEYTTTLDANGNDLGMTNDYWTNGSTLISISPGNGAVFHRFSIFLSVDGLAAGQDAVRFEYGASIGGYGFDFADVSEYPFLAPYTPSNEALANVNPPKMPTTVQPYSDAPSHAPWTINSFDPVTDVFTHELYRGDTESGAGNGTYGDYAAWIQVCEDEPYRIGLLTLEGAGGMVDFTFSPDSNSLQIISNNAGGLGTSADLSYVAATWVPVPEPSTLVLLTSGLAALLCSAWRKLF